jgi:GNAT superfamily N-acetyltransferase
MSARLATADDVPTILTMAEQFVRESGYGMRFDADHATDYLLTLLAHPDALVMVADGGFCTACVSLDWCDAPICYVEKLYLMPSARGSGIARSFVAAVVEFARQHGCSHVFATATAGLGDQVERLFINLFKKYGFHTCGAAVCRSLP